MGLIILKDLLAVMDGVDELTISARAEDMKLLHKFAFRPKEWGLPEGYRMASATGAITVVDARIQKDTLGADVRRIPDELLGATVTIVKKIGNWLLVDVQVDPMQVWSAKQFCENINKRTN